MYIIKRIRVLFKQVDKSACNSMILNVGAGPGTLNSYLVREPPVGSITNVEINSNFKIESLVVADGSRLPFQNNTFDFIVSSDVLEHVEALRRADFVKELLRCSKFGFVITFSKLHKDHVFNGGIKVFEKTWGTPFPAWYLEHNQTDMIDICDLKNLLKESGCRRIEFKPLVGVFTLFFTGLERRMPFKIFRFLSNVTGYLTTRIVDPLQCYGFGVTALK